MFIFLLNAVVISTLVNSTYLNRSLMGDVLLSLKPLGWNFKSLVFFFFHLLPEEKRYWKLHFFSLDYFVSFTFRQLKVPSEFCMCVN